MEAFSQQTQQVQQIEQSEQFKACLICHAIMVTKILDTLNCFTDQDFDFFSQNLNKDTRNITFIQIHEWIVKLNELIAKIPNNYQIDSYVKYENLKTQIKKFREFTSNPAFNVNTNEMLPIIGVTMQLCFRLSLIIGEFERIQTEQFDTRDKIVEKCNQLFSNIERFSEQSDETDTFQDKINECKFLLKRLLDKLDVTESVTCDLLIKYKSLKR